jgi:hypothetical protein
LSDVRYGPEAKQMRRLSFNRFTLSVFAAVVLLAGCGGSQPPIGGPRATPSVVGARAQTSSGSELLYVVTGGPIEIYSYPGGSLLSKFYLQENILGLGACSDSAGNVFVLATDGYIFEYVHGGTTPTQTLYDNGYPTWCSVDPTTGNLAVLNSNEDEQGNVAIYTDATGDPTYYSTSAIYLYDYLTYDDQGNLFVNGQPYDSRSVALAELPAGSGSFETITMTKKPMQAGSMSWYHNYLAVPAGNHGGDIWHVYLSGTTGTVRGKTEAIGAHRWEIFGRSLLGPIGRLGNYLDTWSYPKGGKPNGSLYVGSTEGFAVSVGSNK